MNLHPLSFPYAPVNRSYAPNGLNQYALVGGTAYGYDSNGNLTSAGANLVYDPQGRLYETYKASTGTTRFLYDGDQLMAEYNSAGTLLKRYVHGTGEDDPLLWYEGSGLTDRRSLQTDHQGSIVSVANSVGTATEVYSYDEYGIPGATTYTSRFQYTGQAWIPELGMYYYKARIYSPTLGRFMQTDPIGYKDQQNLYAYVANDPINGRDPSGECPVCLLPFVPEGVSLVSSGLVIVAAIIFGPPKPLEMRRDDRSVPAADRQVTRNDNGGPSDPDSKVQVAAPPQTGSYTNTHESGRTYSGKGSRERSQTSARRIERTTGDRHVATEWSPARSDREAFKDESRKIDQNGGPQSPDNHNRIDSPGSKYRKEDAGLDR